MMKRIGYVLIAIAVLHTVMGPVFYSQQIKDMFQAGIFNSIVPPYWDRSAAFWYFVFGAMLAAYGAMTQWLLNTVGYMPRFWGWSFLAVCMVGIVFMPASGFWLGLLPAAAMIRQSAPTLASRQPVLAR
jgi:hypothetical protein